MLTPVYYAASPANPDVALITHTFSSNGSEKRFSFVEDIGVSANTAGNRIKVVRTTAACVRINVQLPSFAFETVGCSYAVFAKGGDYATNWY